MVIFLYGPDGYRLKQNFQVVTGNYHKKYRSSINLFEFDFSGPADLNKVGDAVKSNSFFDETKLIIFKNIFGDKMASANITELLKDYKLAVDKKIVVLAVESLGEKELLAKNKELFKLLTANGGLVKKSEFLDGSKLTDWIKKEFALRGCSVEASAVRELINSVGNESWALINEIEKLANFRTGIITAADIALLTFKDMNLNIFDFADAVGSGNKARAYEILYKEIKTGRDPYYLLTMSVYQFRNLIKVRDLCDRSTPLNEIVKKSGLHPFVAKKIFNSLKKLNLDDLKKSYRDLLEIDTASKRGTINLADSLFGFVLN